MILIADGGATKTDWAFIGERTDIFSTEGLSPVFCSNEQIVSLLRSVAERIGALPDKVYFYGAGVLDGRLKECLETVFKGAECFCESDLLGAARALFGSKPGIACILGTGSNSCFYDGVSIVDNVRSGGFILGDEASGAYMGKLLVSDYVKELMPADIKSDFEREFHLDYPGIVRQVYKEPQPSRFLASFSPFILEHIDNEYITALVGGSFSAFLDRNVAQYDYKQYAVGFVGSVASKYERILSCELRKRGMRTGRILSKPLPDLISYHTFK